jgi:hypothetical protein
VTLPLRQRQALTEALPPTGQGVALLHSDLLDEKGRRAILGALIAPTTLSQG